MAGIETMPVRIIEADDKQVAILSLVENLQREDLNLIEEAEGYKALMDEGLTIEEVAWPPFSRTATAPATYPRERNPRWRISWA
jgi:hypothetical protein